MQQQFVGTLNLQVSFAKHITYIHINLHKYTYMYKCLHTCTHVYV